MPIKKKPVLIARYDQCDITDSEITYRTDNLSEFEYILEKILDKLAGLDMPEYDKLQDLFGAGSFGELSKELKANKETMRVVSEAVRDSVNNDHDLFQIYFDDEKRNIDEEWSGYGKCGYYMHDDDSEYYTYYKCGSDLLFSVTSRNQSDDYAMYREQDGCILICAGGRQYRFVPVELEYAEYARKCVYDTNDGAIYKIIAFSAYDGSDLEFEASKYDLEIRAFSHCTFIISARYLKTFEDGKTARMTLKEALHVKRVTDRVDRLRELGVELDDLKSSAATAMPATIGDYFNIELVDRYEIPSDLLSLDLVEKLAILNLARTGKRHIYGLPAADDMKARMLSLLLSDNEHKMGILEEAYAIRNELARAIGSSRKFRVMPGCIKEQQCLQMAA